MSISLSADPSLAQGYIKVNGTTAATVTTSGVTSNLVVPSGGSITFPDGTTQTSGKGPAFSAYNSTSITPSYSVNVKITFDTKLFDTNNNFASSRFTPTVAGYYQISAGLITTTTGIFLVALYKNGAVYCELGRQTANAGTISGSSMIYMNGTTDYVEVYTYISNGTIGSSSGGGYPYYWFTGALIRPA